MSYQRISVEQANAIIANGGACILDIRDGASYNSGHIDSAIALSNDNIQEFIANTDKATPLIVYCYHGNSSQSAAGFLSEQGFSNVSSVDGGFEAWKNHTG